MRTSLFFFTCVAAALAGCAGARVPAHSRSPASPPLPTRGDRRTVVRDLIAHNLRILLRDGEDVARTQSGVVIGREIRSNGTESYVLTTAQGLGTQGLTSPKLTVVVDQGSAVEVSAEVVAYSGKESNLALLRIPGLHLMPASLAADRAVQAGDEVVLAASPYGSAISVSGGLVSRVVRDGNGLPTLVQTDALASHGAAGGGLYDASTGELLGLIDGYRTVRFRITEREQPIELPLPGETYAIPAAAVRSFLKAQGLERFASDGAEQAGTASIGGGSTSIQ